MAEQFDVVVIGAGPGGYIAAIRAAQLGLHDRLHRRLDARRTASRRPAAPAPTSAASRRRRCCSRRRTSSTRATRSPSTASSVKGLSIDVAKMLARKDKVVAQNNDGILYLFKKNKIAFFHGLGAFAGKDGDALADRRRRAPSRRSSSATHVIVATGSKPRALPGVAFDNVRVLDNAGALAIPAVPKRLGVVGAGVIGLEMGSVWRRLGAEVTVLEALPAFLGAADEAVAKEAQKLFTKQGLAIHTGVQDHGGRRRQERRDGRVHRRRGQAAQTATFDRLIVSIGRVPNTDGPRRARPSGSRSTSAASSPSTTTAAPTCRTSGRSATSCAARCSRTRPRRRAWRSPSASPASTAHVDFNTIPWVIYTSPEIAWVGQDRAAAEGRRRRLPRRQLPVHRQRPRAGAGRHRGLRQDPRRRARPTASSACTSSARWPPS